MHGHAQLSGTKLLTRESALHARVRFLELLFACVQNKKEVIMFQETHMVIYGLIQAGDARGLHKSIMSQQTVDIA